MEQTTIMANLTEPSNHDHSNGFHVAILFFTLSCIAISNTAILSVIKYTPSLHTTSGFLMASLAVLDLSIGLFMVFPAGASIFNRWIWGDFLCVFSMNLFFVLTTMSIYIVGLMSIDKYIKIAHPLKYNTTVTMKRVVYILILVFVTSFLSLFLHGKGTRTSEYVVYDPDIYICWMSNDSPAVVTSVTLTLFICVVPTAIVVLFCYASIFCISMKQRKQINTTNHTGVPVVSMKGLRTVLLIVGAVAVTWLPIIVTVTLNTYLSSESSVQPLLNISFYAFSLVYSQSFLNWIIYTISQKEFKNGQRRIYENVKMLICHN